MRIEHFVIGALGVIGLVQVALPDRPRPVASTGITVVPGQPSRLRPMPAAAVPAKTADAIGTVAPAVSGERWKRDDQPGIWATPATFSDED